MQLQLPQRDITPPTCDELRQAYDWIGAGYHPVEILAASVLALIGAVSVLRLAAEITGAVLSPALLFLGRKSSGWMWRIESAHRRRNN